MSHFRVERYEPGKAATDFKPGDFILTHAYHPVSRLLRLAQKVRGRERRYSYWSHAAVIVDRDGSLVEAESRGVIRSPLTKYDSEEYHLVHLGSSADERDRKQVAAFADRHYVVSKNSDGTITSSGVPARWRPDRTGLSAHPAFRARGVESRP